MHDQPLKPLDFAVFWVEHVIRHRGAPHLRSAGLDLKWYQRDMIDIIIFLTLVTIILFIIFYIIIKKILGLCFRKKPVVKKSKKNINRQIFSLLFKENITKTTKHPAKNSYLCDTLKNEP